MFTKQITLCAFCISLLGGCASTSPASAIGQCTPGAPRAEINYPEGWPSASVARQIEASGLDRDERRALDARWLEGDLVEPEAVVPPQVRYPGSAWHRHIQGECVVLFAIGVDGKAFAAEPFCSHSVFRASALKTVNEAVYKPVTVDGDVKVRFGVAQPVVYCLD